MQKINRRKFLKQTIIGTAALTANHFLPLNLKNAYADREPMDRVILGKSGIQVSRLAWGTGTNGWEFKSDQTALGVKGFIELAQYAFDSGISFFDVADIYGSHQYLKAALKYIPREKIVILTKIWTRPTDWLAYKDVPTALDRFRNEIGTDMLDIVLLHCQTSPNWLTEMGKACEELSQAKAKGIIRAHGVSCHSFEALKAAVAHDWVDVVLARINHTGSHMDDKPEKVMSVLKQAHNSGKGVLGMKIFGCGDLTREEQRIASLEYVLKSQNVDAMTIGFENKEQISDTITKMNRILKD